MVVVVEVEVVVVEVMQPRLAGGAALATILAGWHLATAWHLARQEEEKPTTLGQLERLRRKE